MDSNSLSPLAERDKSSNESSPLLRNEHPPRPYQAYCVTEASSRPPSPDALIPRPLRFGPSLSTVHRNEPRYLPSTSVVPSTPTAIGQGRSVAAIVSRLEKESDGKEEQSNERPRLASTMLVNSNHITQAVTPRGSLPLKGNQPIMYDRTPSQSRVQRATPEYVATISTCRRKPLPQHAADTSMIHHPLPPLPLEITPLRASYDVQRGSHDTEFDGVNREQAWPPSMPTSSSEKLSEGPQSYNREASASYWETEVAHPQAVHTANQGLDKETSYETLTPRNHTAISPAWTILGGNVQIPSTSEPYEPRGLLSEMDDDRRAFRRTQPKDAKFKYQFGRRPSVRLDKPPLSPLHQSVSSPSMRLSPPTTARSHEAAGHSHVDHRISSLSLRSNTGAQAGPRPPPWGSTDKLELRRQTRSEAREREEARRYRMTVDSESSIYKGSESTDSLRRNTMRREVEEYREQVLHLYPDMAFDGNAGTGGRSCYCVVM